MENELVIEKGIPVPKPKLGRPHSTIWLKMDIGDSVFMAGNCHRNIASYTGSARKQGMRFTARKITENGVSGVRVWRIE